MFCVSDCKVLQFTIYYYSISGRVSWGNQWHFSLLAKYEAACCLYAILGYLVLGYSFIIDTQKWEINQSISIIIGFKILKKCTSDNFKIFLYSAWSAKCCFSSFFFISVLIYCCLYDHILCCTLPSWTPFRCSVARPPHWSPPSSQDSLCVGTSWLCTQTSYPRCPFLGAEMSPTSWQRSPLCRVPLDVPVRSVPSLSWLVPPLSRKRPLQVCRASWGWRWAGRWWRCRSIPWGGRGAAGWGSGPPWASSWWSCENAGGQ